MLYDIIYFTSLVMCITLGCCYKNIEDANTKRNYGTGLGVLAACLICGHYVYHTVIMVWGNIIIIKCCNKRYAYQISLAYTWIFLLYLHFNFQDATYFIWLHQTIALRIVGLAFEMNALDNAKVEQSSDVFAADSRLPTSRPNALDIIAYAYSFIGLHRGPYYKWRTFEDHFKYPFGVLGECRVITIQKLKKAVMFALGYSLLRLKYNSNVYFDEDFYKYYGADFRYLYNIPLLLIYLFKFEFIMMLSASVCTEAGFGVYPAKCQPLPGIGPTVRFSLLNLVSTSPKVALEQEYNFTMLKCFDNERLLLGPLMKDTMRAWDMPTRYWFWSHIYKLPVRASKEVRSALSFLVWTLWRGPTIQHMISCSTLWVHLHLEKEYTELYNTGDQMKMAWDIGFSIMRVFCLIYLTPCLVIKDADILLKYYHSIFWAYHILLIILIIAAIVISKAKR